MEDEEKNIGWLLNQIIELSKLIDNNKEVYMDINKNNPEYQKMVLDKSEAAKNAVKKCMGFIAQLDYPIREGENKTQSEFEMYLHGTLLMEDGQHILLEDAEGKKTLLWNYLTYFKDDLVSMHVEKVDP